MAVDAGAQDRSTRLGRAVPMSTTRRWKEGPEGDGLEVPEVEWRDEGRGTGIVSAALSRPGVFGVQPLYSLDECWWPRTKSTDR